MYHRWAQWEWEAAEEAAMKLHELKGGSSPGSSGRRLATEASSVTSDMTSDMTSDGAPFELSNLDLRGGAPYGPWAPPLLPSAVWCTLELMDSFGDGWNGGAWHGLGLCGVTLTDASRGFVQFPVDRDVVFPPSAPHPPSPPSPPSAPPPSPLPNVPPTIPVAKQPGKTVVDVPALTITLHIESALLSGAELQSVLSALGSYADCAAAPTCEVDSQYS